MRHKNKLTYLQKPKRIRKSKKDFLRGDIHRTATRVSLERTMIPLPYVLLLSVLAATIIGYTSLNFLFSRIHIDGSLYNFMRTSLPAVHVPNIPLPHISITVPHVQVPYIPTPHISFRFIVTPLEQFSTKYGLLVFSYFNPLPYWIEVFATTGQWITWLFDNAIHVVLETTKALQTNGASLLQSIHPLQLFYMAISGAEAVSLSIIQTLAYGTTWISKVFVDYIFLLGHMTTVAGTSLVYAATMLGTTLLKIFVFCGNKIIDLTFQQIVLGYQNISLVILTTLDFLTVVRAFSVQWVFIFSLSVWKIILFTSEIIIHGITMLFTGIFSIVVSIFTVILHVLTIIISWFVSILMAIKKSIDDAFGAIGAFIHLGDPLYQAIGSSITDLFSSMGVTFSVTSKAINGGKL